MNKKTKKPCDESVCKIYGIFFKKWKELFLYVYLYLYNCKLIILGYFIIIFNIRTKMFKTSSTEKQNKWNKMNFNFLS